MNDLDLLLCTYCGQLADTRSNNVWMCWDCGLRLAGVGLRCQSDLDALVVTNPPDDPYYQPQPNELTPTTVSTGGSSGSPVAVILVVFVLAVVFFSLMAMLGTLPGSGVSR